jgi:hypothetical protein
MTVMLVLAFFCTFWMIELLTGRRVGAYAESNLAEKPLSVSLRSSQMTSDEFGSERRRGERRLGGMRDRRQAA